jgi:hypothetical protein
MRKREIIINKVINTSKEILIKVVLIIILQLYLKYLNFIYPLKVQYQTH